MSKEKFRLVKVKTEGEEDAASKDEETNEVIYCEALAETLHHVTLPVTVGFFAPWGRKKRDLLDEIQGAMTRRSKEKKDGKGGGGNVISLISFIWRIIFYHPVFSSAPSKRVRYIFISFDAWEYVGCDRTWAGLVTTLLDETEKKNKILFSFIRAFGGEPSKEKAKVGKRKKWVLKNLNKIFLWMWGLLCVIVLKWYIALLKYHIEIWEQMGYVTTGVIAAVFGLPFLVVAKNLVFTMKKKFQADMKRKDLSAQLGFMHSVKEEVKTTINFLHFMELKEDSKIRVVLEITNLDLCTPDKVVEVLDAINILLCDPDAPFILILAADPSILVECIQQSTNTCNNGYLYLDRIVSLHFSVPQMSRRAKSQLLDRILENLLTRPTTNPGKKDSAGSSKKNTAKNTIIDETEDIHQYLCKEDFDAYFPGNSVQMRRVVNTVLTMRAMTEMGFRPRGGHKTNEKSERETIEQMIDWVVLANFWPCRLSWIFQCVEDDEQYRLEEIQRMEVSGKNAGGHPLGKISEESDNRRLLDLYEANAQELDRMKYSVSKLLELDGDPDLFRILLQRSHFTVGRARYFSDFLINLDFSLKRHFELLRGLSMIDMSRDSHGMPPEPLQPPWDSICPPPPVPSQGQEEKVAG
ncbi:NTPase KAP family P-loop domain-containing protein 1-like [Heteronotia binoei]|uniref:NTPase KAP family P-loop domain-containing protein 1-like n=1 Tax=Heteronotia binoei TaxID=13085 RepID=UPI002931AEED|nr:NTPase KAP family P-loop domain-containing protein 1-like [Heteronotia binoei]